MQTPGKLGLLSRRRLPGDRGAVSIVVVLMTLILILMLAFVVDFGRVYATNAKLQNAADAAALAAAKDLAAVCTGTAPALTDTSAAEACKTAGKYAGLNGVPLSSTTLTSPYTGNAKRIEVVTSEYVDFVFGRIVGTNGVTVTARAVGAKEASSEAKYGFYVANLYDIDGGGNGLVILGSPVFTGTQAWTGNTKNFIQYGVYTRTGATLATGYYQQTPPIYEWEATNPTDAATWLGYNANQKPGTFQWTATYTTATGIDTDVPGTAREYADLLELHDADLLADAGEVESSPEPDADDEVGYYYDQRNSAAFATVNASGNGANRRCVVNLALYSGSIVGVKCSDNTVPMRVYGSSTSVKMVTHSQPITIYDDTNFNGTSCTSQAIIYNTGSGSAGNVNFSGSDKVLCGTIYSPDGIIDTNGNGAQVFDGRIISAGFTSGGNSGVFRIDTVGDPFSELNETVLLVE